MEIPRLETDRLILRPHRESDFPAIAQFFADPVSQFYGGPVAGDEAWRKLAMYAGHWSLRGYGPWALERKDTGAFVGQAGPWYPEGWIEPEITWAIVPGQYGHGFATEGARRALHAAYDLFGWTTAVSVIAVANPASIAVAERLGARREREIDYRYGPGLLYRHLPPGSPEPEA